jgi:K+-sensing histidine kinase KdpD
MVRPRHLPNTWYALDRVPLAAIDGEGAAFVLRDVSDSGDLQVEREAFLSVLSHELRTPLTTIYAGSSVLARRQRLSAPATRTLAMDISLEAARLYDLVENLLVIARLERRMLHPIDEPVDLGMALDAETRIASGRVGGIRIEREGSSTAPPVHGDATYVAQACRNLIQSMLRVPGRDAAVRLVARLEVDRVAREVSVRILDEGPSLTIDELDRAFDLPLSTATGRLGGMGMGPFVARHAVAAMGGRTWARDRVGGGLEMGFALRVHDGVGRRPGSSAGH